MSGSIAVRAYQPRQAILRGPREAWQRVADTMAGEGGSYAERSARVRIVGLVTTALARSTDDMIEITVHPDMIRPVLMAGRPGAQEG